jgi:hypothetical protein
MKHFEEYYGKCVRDEWMPHTLDYAVLKEKLVRFSKRRNAVQRLIRPDGYLPALSFQELLPQV